ncbi:MAG: nitroreductase [Elusimicrobia bacterium]|nr:nitroreductase [Elusimicrobiota bacterium]
MNSVIETIKKRRSVRHYDSKPIPKDILEIIIDAGNLAPTGGNAQAWRFVVITDEKFRKKLTTLALPRYKNWMTNASQSLKEMRKVIDDSVEDPVYYSAPVVVFVIGTGMTSDCDCSMVCENIMLSARSFDIGSCWVFFGQLVRDEQEVRKALELKESEKVYGPILLGYPKGDFPDSMPKKKPEIKWI